MCKSLRLTQPGRPPPAPRPHGPTARVALAPREPRRRHDTASHAALDRTTPRNRLSLHVSFRPGLFFFVFLLTRACPDHSWWTDVCEDAATFKQASGTSYVNGGGARGADDKVLQHNGGGTVAVKNFFASKVGKVYRSCGNCDSQYQRSSSFSNVRVDDADVVAGVNVNYGDRTSVSGSCVLDSAVCWLYNGNNNGAEPTKVGSGASSTYCSVASVKTSGC